MVTFESNYEHYLDTPNVYWPLVHKHGYSNFDTNIANDNTLFTAHPNRLVCSYDQENMMKHIKLNNGGGVMFMSYNKPKNCEQVKCPKLVKDIITVKGVDHYDPKFRKDRLTCWK